MSSVGFLGAGQLGEPMVHRLLAAGHQVSVIARREEVRARLSEAGATLADSVAELASTNDIVIGCLFSDDQLRETGLGPEGFIARAKPKAIFVSHTTGTAATLADLQTSSPSPPAIVDAPVSGTADDVAQGKLRVLIGGPTDVVDQVQPVLAAYAGTVIRTGETGTALSVKLINNLLFAANTQLVATAVQLGEKLQVAPGILLRALEVCSGGSAAAGYMVSAGGLEAFAQQVAPFMRKDVSAAVAAARSAGVALGTLQSVAESGPLEFTADR